MKQQELRGGLARVWREALVRRTLCVTRAVWAVPPSDVVVVVVVVRATRRFLMRRASCCGIHTRVVRSPTLQVWRVLFARFWAEMQLALTRAGASHRYS